MVPSFDATIDMTILPIPGVAELGDGGLADVLLKKADPGVRVVCFRVRAGGIEHAFDRVRGAGDIGPAFDSCERRSDQHQQEADDADDDE